MHGHIVDRSEVILRTYTKDDALGDLKLWLYLDFCNSTQAFGLRELRNANAGGSPLAGALQVFFENAAPWAVKKTIDQELGQYKGRSIAEIDSRASEIKKKLGTSDPFAAYRKSFCGS